MSLWDNKGVPHKGWHCVGMIDLGEDAEDMDFETRKAELYEQCQMCKQEGIRYVHIMEHPSYSGQLRVGCICAENMENDYVAPRGRENDLINRHNRKMNFLKREWQPRTNGNLVLKYKGSYITIMRSKFGQSEYGVAFAGKYIWNYQGKKIRDIRTAKLAAFDIFDQ
ncbi:hypothetical protein SDC9_60425 [bioreactor metagenome]|uniref:Uncharacterized protein n=1 Tax=bioreactor metagenome TaxID=1076179 RepID=A0A644XCZ0_9ZZZZ